jgi:hypothetical protein
MRRCRYRPCGKIFQPAQPSHHYCCWEHRVTDVGEHYERRPYDRQGHGDSYDQGFWAGARARLGTAEIPPGIWRGMIFLCHPDRFASEPGLQTLAGEVTRWLLQHRPTTAERT